MNRSSSFIPSLWISVFGLVVVVLVVQVVIATALEIKQAGSFQFRLAPSTHLHISSRAKSCIDSFSTCHRSRRNLHCVKMSNISDDQDDDDYGYGDGSFLANFDPDEAIANRYKNAPPSQPQPQPKPKSSSSPSKMNTNTKATFSYDAFGPNSRFSTGNIDSTKFMPLPTLPSKRWSTNSNNLVATTSTMYGAQTGDSQNKRGHTARSIAAASVAAQQYDDSSLLSPVKKVKLETHRTGGNNNDIFGSINSNSTFASDQTIDIDPHIEAKYSNTLERYFGYKKFRNGQLQIVHSIVHEARDASVFWSTGSGKSICYQVPPLHMNKIAIIISPLISLMEDQVSKLNGLLLQGSQGTSSNGGGESNKGDIAIYLGSGQMDSSAQQKALRGDYTFIYCTPEKLLGSGGDFLNSLGELHERKRIRGTRSSHDSNQVDNGRGNICLIAIDESHCVSEWGHDFRPQFRSIGNEIRAHPTLSTIPIVALTATAIPRVQNDIISSLHLRNPLISKQSFDRTNLILSVKRKPPSGGFRAAFRPFVKELKQKYNSKTKGSGSNDSTIIYCPTQKSVEEVGDWLSSEFGNESKIKVQSYHGGLSSMKRTDAHINFLTGKTTIIVATIAFGMGIDKPDTRRIIHYGPPKTVEEYYQQIGRAGRDGLESYCIMYCDSGDFEAYKTDFYLGGLGEEARALQMKSIDSLRRFAMSDEVCRRAELLRFFGEVPSFGERCGTCDTCRMRQQFSNDMERDFANEGARIVLYAIAELNGKQGLSVIEKVLRGNTVEEYRYRNGTTDHRSIGANILKMKGQMKGVKKKMPVSYFTKGLLPALVDRNFVEIKSQTSKTQIYAGRTATWSSYDLTSRGRSAFMKGGPIILPVPASLRELEEEQRQALQNSLDNLKKAGADVDQIPKEELEEGDGEVLKALKTWYNYLDLLQRNEKDDRVDELDDLKSRIEGWRSDMAVKFRMSPADVMPEHLLVKVAYAAASLKKGKLEKEALLAAGVRSGGIDDLVETISSWLEETLLDCNVSELNGGSEQNYGKMVMPDEVFRPLKPWDYFVYKPNKKTGLASWESSYNRFAKGEHPQTIAMSPANGKPIQIATVMGHILDGLVSGRPVDLKRISEFVDFPNQNEWEEMIKMESQTGCDVTGDPSKSGKDGGPLRMLDFLTPVMGDEFAAKDFKERTEEEKVLYSKWCQLLKSYMTMRRIGFVPTFSKSKEE